MQDEVRSDVDSRLRKVAGQVAGIQKMVADDRYCVDVLLQIAAARAALERAGQIVLRAHVETCVSDAVTSRSPRAAREKLDELMEVFSRFGGLKTR